MYSKLSHSWLKHWDFILLDVVCLQVSFFIAFIMRHTSWGEYEILVYKGEAVILFLAQMLAVFFHSAFSGVLRRGYYSEFINTLKHVAMVLIYALVILFIDKETDTYSRIVLVVTGSVYATVSYVGRIILKYFVKRSVANKKGHSLIVVTTKDQVDEVIENLEKEAYQRFKIKAVCLVDGQDIAQVKNHAVIDGTDKMLEYVCREWVDEVFFALPSEENVSRKLLETLAIMGVTTHVPIVAKRMRGSKQFVETLGGYAVLTTSISIVETRQVVAKRILDILGGIIGCLITIILTIIVGPIIYIKSPGPIFFKQTRIGKNGRKFKMYKFRSMYMDAEERKKELMAQNKMCGHMFKLDYDPRIIGSEKIGKDGKPKGIGNFIRATSIDEFPQFWNVLKGDMSLVGTRPPTLNEYEQYELRHKIRLSAKPGLTGMWQTSGRSSITNFEEVVKLDTEYIENWSIWLDIKLILKTVKVVLDKTGSK